MKEINFIDDGRKYTLAFTRDSIAKLEQRHNFKLEDIGDKPVSTLPLLFYGAFLARQPYVKREATDGIFEKFANRRALIEKLSDMYLDTMNSLVDDASETEGNVTWEANW